MAPANHRPRPLLLCLALAGQLWPIQGAALSSDRSEPIYIEADKASLDEKNGISVYQGSVFLHQGTLQIHGKKMTVLLQDKQLTRITIEGSPARFSQRPDDADTDQQAEAEHIEYHTDTQRLLLQGSASIRQSGREEFRSDRIEFNLRNNTVNAGGDGSGDRVHITLQPDKPDSETPDSPPE